MAIHPRKRYGFRASSSCIKLTALDLVVTCFPERWEHQLKDPLNVLNGIMEEMNAKTRPSIRSAYDLAILISSRCSGSK